MLQHVEAVAEDAAPILLDLVPGAAPYVAIIEPLARALVDALSKKTLSESFVTELTELVIFKATQSQVQKDLGT